MIRHRLKLVFAFAAVAILAFAGIASAEGGGPKQFKTTLDGYAEQPLALSTAGNGMFVARINDAAQTIDYSLTFGMLTSTTTQAHIHFGSPSQVGGVAAFLCTNLGNGPAGTQACPNAGGTITGTIHPADVIGPAGQGIAPGEFAELVAAMRAGSTYVNVHSTMFPVGEIRGPLGEHDHSDQNDQD